MTALIDTGFLLAVLDSASAQHDVCRLIIQREHQPALPDVVLPELAYMLLREAGYHPLARFLRSLAAGELALVQATLEDLDRTAAILVKYADSRIDFVDCAVMALAERLNVTRILTLDQRHFRLFRPRHCPAFELLP